MDGKAYYGIVKIKPSGKTEDFLSFYGSTFQLGPPGILIARQPFAHEAALDDAYLLGRQAQEFGIEVLDITTTEEAPPPKDFAFVLRALKLIADARMCQDVTWRMAGSCAPVSFFITYMDELFFKSTHGAQELTPSNIDLFEQTIRDLTMVSVSNYLSGSSERDTTMHCVANLFCARVRQLRPQGAMYRFLPSATWALFDACGPVREVNRLNPCHHPSEMP